MYMCNEMSTVCECGGYDYYRISCLGYTVYVSISLVFTSFRSWKNVPELKVAHDGLICLGSTLVVASICVSLIWFVWSLHTYVTWINFPQFHSTILLIPQVVLHWQYLVEHRALCVSHTEANIWKANQETQPRACYMPKPCQPWWTSFDPRPQVTLYTPVLVHWCR